MATWFKKGKEGITQSQQESKKQQMRQSEKGPIPFTVKYGESSKFIFVDDPLFFLYQHTVKVGNNFMRLTCIRDVETCPACESGDNPAYAVVGTVIDPRPFQKRDGTTVKFSKKPFIAKGKAREIILRRLEENGGHLKGFLMQTTRGNQQTECNVGEDIQVKQKMTKDQLMKTVPEGTDPKEWFKPLNYEEIFAPKSAKDMAELLGVDPPMGSDDNDDIFGEGEAAKKADTKAASDTDDLFGTDDTPASDDGDSDIGEPDTSAEAEDDDDEASIDDLLD